MLSRMQNLAAAGLERRFAREVEGQPLIELTGANRNKIEIFLGMATIAIGDLECPARLSGVSPRHPNHLGAEAHMFPQIVVFGVIGQVGMDLWAFRPFRIV